MREDWRRCGVVVAWRTTLSLPALVWVEWVRPPGSAFALLRQIVDGLRSSRSGSVLAVVQKGQGFDSDMWCVVDG